MPILSTKVTVAMKMGDDIISKAEFRVWLENTIIVAPFSLPMLTPEGLINPILRRVLIDVHEHTMELFQFTAAADENSISTGRQVTGLLSYHKALMECIADVRTYSRFNAMNTTLEVSLSVEHKAAIGNH